MSKKLCRAQSTLTLFSIHYWNLGSGARCIRTTSILLVKRAWLAYDRLPLFASAACYDRTICDIGNDVWSSLEHRELIILVIRYYGCYIINLLHLVLNLSVKVRTCPGRTDPTYLQLETRNFQGRLDPFAIVYLKFRM